MKSRRELKEEAKNLLRGRWKEAILLNLVPVLIEIGVTVIALLGLFLFEQRTGMVSNMTTNAQNYDSSPSGNIANTGLNLLAAFLTIGISFTFLDWLRNPEMTIHPFSDAFQVFKKDYLIGTFLVFALTTFFTALWSLLFIIPGIIKSVAYSQAYFIYKDRQDTARGEKVSALDCITASKELMKGHKWEFFVLQLSFLGWGVLSVLSLGIGLLWLNPYTNATYAAFYKNLSEENRFNKPEPVFVE